MITAKDTNLSRLNDYLEVNAEQNRKVALRAFTRLQRLAAVTHDPLLDESLEQETQIFVSTEKTTPKILRCEHCNYVFTYKGRKSWGYTLCRCKKPVKINKAQKREIAS